MSEGGVSSDSVTVTGSENRTTLLFPSNRTGENASATQVNVSIDNSPHEEARDDYFRSAENDWEYQPSTGNYTCNGVDQVYVRQTVIDIRIED